MNPPILTTTTLATADLSSGTYVYDMQPGGLASLQLNGSFATADSTTITLKLSNDGVTFVAFSTNKTGSISSATSGTFMFELGQIDYRYLQVSWTAPSTYGLTLTGVLYQIPLITQTLQ